MPRQSGSRDALPRPCPLRTVRATRRGTRLKQAARASRVEVPPRRLEDPLPEPPCVLLMGAPVSRVPLQHVLGSVHRHRRLTCPSVPAATSRFAPTAHLPTSARFRARAPGPVSGQLYTAAGVGAGHTAVLSCCLSAAGIGFLGILSRPGIPPPLRSAYHAAQQATRTRTGFPCSARVRPGWLRMPSLPRGRRCPQRPVFSRPPACRIATASPWHPGPRPAPGCISDEASARVHCHSPHASLPLTCDPGRNGILGLFPELRTPPGRTRQRTSGRGQAWTLPGLRP